MRRSALCSASSTPTVKEEFGDHGDATLLRDPMNQFRANPVGQGAQLLFDPLGGTFIHAPRDRRRLFRLRSTLTMSLWDMAVKSKRDVILDRLASRSH